MKCDRCNGIGTLSNKDITTVCPKCLGEKELDWVENIVGKDKPEFNGNIASSSVSYVGGGGGGASYTWNNVQGISVQCIGGGGGGSNGANKQYVDDNVKIEIDSQYKQVIKDELLEQIIDKMDEMIKTRVQIELIKRGIK